MKSPSESSQVHLTIQPKQLVSSMGTKPQDLDSRSEILQVRKKMKKQATKATEEPYREWVEANQQEMTMEQMMNMTQIRHEYANTIKTW